jgi:RIO kinase 1
MPNAPERDEAFELFRRAEWITGEPLVVKSGKEATVYRCEAHPATGLQAVAAKYYRPREHRGFKNDTAYREGRAFGDERTERAVHGGSRYGRQVAFEAWIGTEFDTLRLLHGVGVDVPKPLTYSDRVLLMEFIGVGPAAAPPLAAVDLETDVARDVLDRLLWNVETMLGVHRVHADLSEYNVLWDGRRPVIIDFPQCVDPRYNRLARDMLFRDVRNVCRYFGAHGTRVDAEAFAGRLWRRYTGARQYSFN